MTVGDSSGFSETWISNSASRLFGLEYRGIFKTLRVIEILGYDIECTIALENPPHLRLGFILVSIR
jgi:hypothetical protein